MNEIEQDKNLIIKLLEKDIMSYKNYIDDIKKMNIEDLKHFIDGDINYKYTVKRKNIFKLLVEKVDNYRLFFSWGYNPKFYPYLEEIWMNYFCVQDLKGNKEDEEIKKFLESCKINYSKWPEDIKLEFKKIINSNNDTIVFKFKDIYKELKRLPKYFLEKLKGFIDYLEKMGLTKLKELSEYLELNAIKEIIKNNAGTIMTSVSLFSFGKEAITFINKNIIKGDGTQKSIFSKETISYFKNNGKDLFTTKRFLFMESFFALGNIISAYQDYLQIKEMAHKIEVYQKELKNIIDSFNDHIHNFDINKKNLKQTLDEILNNIEGDLNNLKNLIDKINDSIEECERQKKKSTIGIISSSIGVIGGIGSAILSGGATLPILLHSSCALLNAASAGGNIYNLIETFKIIKDLKKLMEETKKARDEVKSEINALRKEYNEMFENTEKLLPKYFEL